MKKKIKENILKIIDNYKSILEERYEENKELIIEHINKGWDYRAEEGKSINRKMEKMFNEMEEIKKYLNNEKK